MCIHLLIRSATPHHHTTPPQHTTTTHRPRRSGGPFYLIDFVPRSSVKGTFIFSPGWTFDLTTIQPTRLFICRPKAHHTTPHHTTPHHTTSYHTTPHHIIPHHTTPLHTTHHTHHTPPYPTHHTPPYPTPPRPTHTSPTPLRTRTTLTPTPPTPLPGCGPSTRHRFPRSEGSNSTLSTLIYFPTLPYNVHEENPFDISDV
jgi:hypothetical protein